MQMAFTASNGYCGHSRKGSFYTDLFHFEACFPTFEMANKAYFPAFSGFDEKLFQKGSRILANDAE